MSLFCQKLYKKSFLKIKNVSLQSKLNSEPCEANHEYFIDNQRKNIICGKIEASLSASDRNWLFEGVMTVEAALIGWIFFMIVISLASVIQIAYVYGAIQQDLILTGQKVSISQAVTGGGTEQIYVLFAAEKTNASECYQWIQGEKTGISLLGSSVDQSEGNIEIFASYKVKPQLMWLPHMVIPLKHHILMKAWTGYHHETQNAENESHQTYYVSDYESVYHTSAQCTHLRLSIRLVDYMTAVNSTNSDGRHYGPCQQCHASSGDGQVLITDSGEKYHSTLGCPALKRSVREIHDVGQLKPCSRCGGQK